MTDYEKIMKEFITCKNTIYDYYEEYETPEGEKVISLITIWIYMNLCLLRTENSLKKIFMNFSNKAKKTLDKMPNL